MDQNFLFFELFLRFFSALAILEPQIYVVIEQFGAVNISLLSGRLASYLFLKNIFHAIIFSMVVTIWIQILRILYLPRLTKHTYHAMIIV